MRSRDANLAFRVAAPCALPEARPRLSRMKLWARKLWTVWGAMLTSVAMLTAISYAVLSRGEATPLPESMHLAMGAVAVVAALAGNAVLRWLSVSAGRDAEQGAELEVVQRGIFGRLVLAWGLTESVALAGLVLTLLDGRFEKSWHFFAAAGALMFVRHPGRVLQLVATRFPAAS